MLIDTDVIIWFMRGSRKAGRVIEENPGFRMSAVTYMELVQGIRNKRELNLLRKAIKSWQARVVYVDQEMSAKAVFFVEHYALSHGISIADALIAGTAVTLGESLLTGNKKHYAFIKGIEISKFFP